MAALLRVANQELFNSINRLLLNVIDWALCQKKMRSYYELTLRTESPSIFVDDLSRKDRSDSASRVL